ncbi:MAG: triose-phosphate isomerase, partial [Planctomycetota bacterium]
MRKPFLAGNWKMHHTRVSAAEFVETFLAGLRDAAKGADLALFPAYPLLPALAEALAGSGVAVGAQEMHEADQGAFTGAVSAAMILDAGATHVLIGHSERRQLFGETDAGVNGKLKKALASGLSPVLCIGETLAERERGETEGVVLGQLEKGLAEIGEPGPLTVAYEPVWAIGTGHTAAPAQAQEVHALIRRWLGERFGPAGAG